MANNRFGLVGCLAVIVGLSFPIHPAYAPPVGRMSGRSEPLHSFEHFDNGGRGFQDFNHDLNNGRDDFERLDKFKRESPGERDFNEFFNKGERDFRTSHDPKEIAEQRNQAQRKTLERATRDWSPTPPGSEHFSVFDATKNPEERQALEDRLQSDPIARRINLVDWRLSARPTLAEIGDVLDLASRKLPSKAELALFLDPSRFGSAVSEIKAAWNRDTTASMPHADYLDEFLEARRGGLLLAVGHVEGGDFVMQDAVGHSMTLSVPLLLQKIP